MTSQAWNPKPMVRLVLKPEVGGEAVGAVVGIETGDALIFEVGDEETAPPQLWAGQPVRIVVSGKRTAHIRKFREYEP